MHSKELQEKITNMRILLFQYTIPAFMQSMLEILTLLKNNSMKHDEDIEKSKQMQNLIVTRLGKKDYLYALELVQYELIPLYDFKEDGL